MNDIKDDSQEISDESKIIYNATDCIFNTYLKCRRTEIEIVTHGNGNVAKCSNYSYL